MLEKKIVICLKILDLKPKHVGKSLIINQYQYLKNILSLFDYYELLLTDINIYAYIFLFE